MIFFGRPQERQEAVACQVAPTCLALPCGFVERSERRNASLSAHLHAPFVFELGNLLCRPDAIIVLVATAGLRQRGQCGKDKWCPPAPHLGG